MREKIIGVILAAGRGTRMDPFSDRCPKPILPICNKPLLQYQISAMKSAGITEIIIVVGHLGYEIAKTLGEGEKFGVKIRYVEQKNMLGIAHAVGNLEKYISSPFLLFLGDIFFVSTNLSLMVDIFHTEKAGAVLAVKEESDPEAIKKNFVVILDGNGMVKRVIEKPRYVPNKLKGCGLYLFDLQIFDAIRRTPRTAMRDEYEITDSIQILIEYDVPVKIAPVIECDINLTYPIDLLSSNLYQLRNLGVDKHIGNGGVIPEEAQIINSVIGDNVILKNPIKIKNSVIFNDTIVQMSSNIENFIITPERVIDCRCL